MIGAAFVPFFLMSPQKTSAAESVVLFVDGACRGNPGPASAGVVIRSESGEVLAELSEFIGPATNNIAEYLSLIFGLEQSAIMGARRVLAHTDSELMARQFSGEYQVREPQIKILQKIIKRLARSFESCQVRHIPREQNRDADRLANAALDLHL